jgi:hypothetical protein
MGNKQGESSLVGSILFLLADRRTMQQRQFQRLSERAAWPTSCNSITMAMVSGEDSKS